ncbi:hypothetical protein [Sulfurimonas autotrophica]|uniref:Uncharacterized protein n=1 Tax=Sulfurimonas autotrophica (strain ATCC BAA-671 / DSM 16294 / JCM 11897 / OK10) TaxID=563040 RepID=E0UUS8_SULAO|nr:hypothetical protein [Sulfurimonas autotrophica]ADN09582.1 conserved hypothetical protein [Sulfurimonas autotrophica DSM 16294]
MKQETYELFKNESVNTIVNEIDKELKTRNESPFWSDKIVPFSRAILSVLVPLRDNDLLFTPEGKYIDILTPEIFLQWSDFLSLKTLAFTLADSNEAKKLLRTKLDDEKCENYMPIDLSDLGTYLSRYTVNLENEGLDFPIANYNLHQGVSNVIKSLL